MEAERAAQMEMSHLNAKERTAREVIKRQAAQETALKIEQLCLKYQQEESAHQRAHELMMLDRQLQLEQLKMGIRPGPVIDPQLEGL